MYYIYYYIYYIHLLSPFDIFIEPFYCYGQIFFMGMIGMTRKCFMMQKHYYHCFCCSNTNAQQVIFIWSSSELLLFCIKSVESVGRCCKQLLCSNGKSFLYVYAIRLSERRKKLCCLL